MKKSPLSLFALFVTLFALPVARAQHADLAFLHNNRPVLDAHNCYPYDGQWTDRVRRALDSGFPVSIEQDLAWYVDPATGKGRVVVSHTPRATGSEPTLRDYFFEQVRPIVESAIAENHRDQWPLIVLHFDFKDNRPAILEAVWNLLDQYRPWLSTAVKTADPAVLSPIERRPILVVTEDNDTQQQIFYDRLHVGDRLLLFGSAHTAEPPAGLSQADAEQWEVTASPATLLASRPTTWRRWWNLPWNVVEQGGQQHAGDWTQADDRRLRALVDYAHAQNFWIRFYTLDGFSPSEDQGWGQGYNFGSKAAVLLRWKAAIAAHVDFLATDQYEALGALLPQTSTQLRPGAK